MFGLKEAEVAGLVRAVTTEGDLDRDAIEERFARATWSCLSEPGDGVAGAIIEAIGAPKALAAVVEKWTADALLAQFADSAVGLDTAELQKGIDRWQPRLKSSTALLALRQAARFGAMLRIPSDANWPIGMEALEVHGPLALWTRGTDDAYQSLERSIALVGARAATGYGEHVAMEASAGLVDRGYSIVSGAAYGIDGMAHRAALASHGFTIAFLAGGVDRFYPSGHDALLTRIVESGVVISELPCGASPTKWRFLQRNRLIAASSLATVVLEAGWRSGSLNTASHAATMGRPLGAVPGPVTSAASAGCHRLIREYSAICVTNPDEMAQLAPLGVFDLDEQVSVGDSPEVTRLLDAVSTHAPRSGADIASRAGLSLGATYALLAQLHLDGRVRDGQRGWTKPMAPTSSAPTSSAPAS